MKEYLEGVKKWMLIFFIICLGAAMGWGTKIIIFLIAEGHLGYILTFIAYPFLIPLFTIAGQTIFREEDKTKRPIWVDISPVTLNGARYVATSAKPVHPPKAVPPPK
ncbi:MAG: hypothetical protein PHG19_04040 [Anaerotignum sp.]|nr:hypothetical protein [Anaerotignum sp.]